MILGIVAPAKSVCKFFSMGHVLHMIVVVWLVILLLLMIVRKVAVSARGVYQRAFTIRLGMRIEFLKDVLKVVIIRLSFLGQLLNVIPSWAVHAAKKMPRMRRKCVWNQTTLSIATIFTWIKWMSRDTLLCSWPWLWLCFFEGKWCDCGWFVICFGFCAIIFEINVIFNFYYSFQKLKIS